jgi:hypothetical protein
MTRQAFLEHPVLERDLGHHLLQLSVLRPQFLDLVAARLSNGIPRQLLLAGFEKVLAPAVVEVRRDALSAAQLGDALLTAQALEYDPDLLFRGKLPAGPAADLTYRRIRGFSRTLLSRSPHSVATH